MDLPARVVIYCPALEIKNKQGRLMGISPHGYYEVILELAERMHTTYLPIDGTVLVFAEAHTTTEQMPGLER